MLLIYRLLGLSYPLQKCSLSYWQKEANKLDNPQDNREKRAGTIYEKTVGYVPQQKASPTLSRVKDTIETTINLEPRTLYPGPISATYY